MQVSNREINEEIFYFATRELQNCRSWTRDKTPLAPPPPHGEIFFAKLLQEKPKYASGEAGS